MQLSSLQKGLVGHWSLDKQSFNPATKRFTDKSAYSNHGTGIGTHLGSVDPDFQADHMGQLLRATPFDGATDIIQCEDNSSLDITNEITIGSWIYPLENRDAGIVAKRLGLGAANVNYNFYFSSAGKIGFYSGGATVVTSINTVPLYTWSHVVVTVSSTNTHFYINSVLDSSHIFGLGISNNHPLVIGWNGYLIEAFYGIINEVLIYNRILSQPEITLLYESYRPKIIMSTTGSTWRL